MKKSRFLVGFAAIAGIAGMFTLSAPNVIAQIGTFFGFPIVGQGAYCLTTVNPLSSGNTFNPALTPPVAPPFGSGVAGTGNCTSVAPAGPAFTGNEQMVANTNLPGNQNPQTVLMPASLLASRGEGSERNSLIGGDFDTNLWQRGTTPISATTASTTTMSADRWGAYSSGNTLTINKQTGASDTSPIIGLNATMRVVRPSGTNTTSICVGQILPQAESQRFIGNEAIFSFTALANSGYLQTNQTVIARIYAWTSTDSSTPGTNTDAMFKETLTNQTIVNTPTNLVNASGVLASVSLTAPAVIPLTASFARYSVAGQVPVTIGSTAVTGVGVTLCTGTYPASTGVAGDWFEFGNAQLEPSTPPLWYQGAVYYPANTAPGGFTRRTPAVEALAELTYSYVFTDGAATVRYASGFSSTTALAQFYLQFPVEMREVPTLTVGTTISFAVLHQTTTTACGTSIGAVSSSSTKVGAGLLCTTGGTALTAGEGSLLVGAATAGTMTYSAEP